ncbi:hypothetical protein L2E82_39194 [Cichorium intybus]|uniref:Uncharacterized protein n=1 Tax=Cichorium intybus TaxID=13427 RepID=A0ACB9AGU2_CICIN|nr:hypothetical protein L2E82_39194 [Cichorium intybus]
MERSKSSVFEEAFTLFKTYGDDNIAAWELRILMPAANKVAGTTAVKDDAPLGGGGGGGIVLPAGAGLEADGGVEVAAATLMLSELGEDEGCEVKVVDLSGCGDCDALNDPILGGAIGLDM